MRLISEFTKGVFKGNPTFVLMLGICPVLATTTNVVNAISMGLAATAVLASSNVIISMLRKVIPSAVRIPCYIVVIASFVTIVDMVMKGYFYEQSKSLSIFIPLIVVNCIILGRAEAFAAKNDVLSSLMDGLGSGLGFICSLTLVATIREILGNGTLAGFPLYLDAAGRAVYQPMTILVLAPGAFIVLGLLMAFFRYRRIRRNEREMQEALAEA